MSIWFEDSSFWEELFPYMFGDDMFKIADDEVNEVLELTGFSDGNVLDMCCGPGRHSISLAKRGIAVTALDHMPLLIQKGKEKATNLKLDIEFILADIRHFVRPNYFTLILNICTSFGYFPDEKQNLQVLVNAYESLQPGGILLIDLMGKEVLANRFQSTTSKFENDGTLFITRHSIFNDWTLIRNEWILINDLKVKSFTFEHFIYSGRELKALLQNAGFKDVLLYGDLKGTEYGIRANRLIAVAKKSKN